VSIEWVKDEQSALSSAWHLQRTGNFVAALDLAQDSLLSVPGLCLGVSGKGSVRCCK
jgi:hypothetical protein